MVDAIKVERKVTVSSKGERSVVGWSPLTLARRYHSVGKGVREEKQVEGMKHDCRRRLQGRRGYIYYCAC